MYFCYLLELEKLPSEFSNLLRISSQEKKGKMSQSSKSSNLHDGFEKPVEGIGHMAFQFYCDHFILQFEIIVGLMAKETKSVLKF